MKKIMKSRILVSFVVGLLLVFSPSFFTLTAPVYAASNPALGGAASFAILSSTYTNTVAGTTITGDVGYTTGPAMAPTINGTVHHSDGTYSTAGTDQGSALVDINNQACTHTFPAGAVNLSTDTSHGTIGVYAPGVYCTTSSSAASIGAGGITLNGSGTYIFKIDGALTTAANSVVTLSNGASSCDVFWAPTGATTLGANSTFAGTDIDDAGITIGSTVNWAGRALSYGGTVSTDVDTITTNCSVSAVTSSTTTSSSSTSSFTSTTEAPNSPCPTIQTGAFAPTVIDSRRVDANSIYLSWGPYSGTNKFNIRYGLTSNNLIYNTDVTGFSTTIGHLPANQPIWVRIAVRNECQIGDYEKAVLIGSPELPNTGVGTNNKDNWIVCTGCLVILGILYFAWRWRKNIPE